MNKLKTRQRNQAKLKLKNQNLLVNLNHQKAITQRKKIKRFQLKIKDHKDHKKIKNNILKLKKQEKLKVFLMNHIHKIEKVELVSVLLIRKLKEVVAENSVKVKSLTN